MSEMDGWHDEAAGACAVLEVELRLPVVNMPGEDDRRVHEAWQALATVPGAIRREYMRQHGISEAEWLSWFLVELAKRA